MDLQQGVVLKEHELDMLIFFAIAGCLMSAAVTYLVLDYRRHGEREVDLQKVLNVQQEVAKARKISQGYVQYKEFLPGAKLAATEKVRTLATKVIRDQIHIEVVKRETLKTNAIFVVNYVTEYFFCFDLRPDNFDIVATTGGIEIRVGKPTLYGAPYVRSSSHERLTTEAVGDEKDVLRQINGRLPGLAQDRGTAMASEDTIRALCDRKLIDLVSTFLAAQTGVTQVPVISVVYK